MRDISTIYPCTHTMMLKEEKRIKQARLGEEAYQEWLNQPPIQFPLHLESLIQNLSNKTSSSHVMDGGNDVEVGMDYLL